MDALAAAHPLLLWFALTTSGVVLFVLIVTVKVCDRSPAFSLIALAVLVTGWLFGAGLVFKQADPTSIRWDLGWARDPGAWQWTGLLLVAFAGVMAAALALRSFSRGRCGQGWWCAACTGACYGTWAAIVNFGVELAVLSGAVGAVGLTVAGWWAECGLATDRSPVRAPLIIVSTIVTMTTLGVLVVLSIPTGG